MRSFGIVLLAALAYFSCGKLGLFLAIPPGYATAIWPSSGVALALALRFGRLSYSGTYIGSFLVNISVSHALANPNLTTLLMPAIIACGAVLQAELGRALVARFVADIWSHDHSIVFILLLGGPIACLLASTVGASTLLGFGQIDWTHYGDVWLTWWIGDSLGVLAFTPALLILLAPYHTISMPRRIIVVAPLMAMFLLVTLAYIFVRDFEQQQRRELVDDHLQQIHFAVEKEFQIIGEVADSFRSYFSSVKQPSMTTFNRMAQGYLMRHPSLQALEWVPAVPQQDRERLENAMRAQGFTQFEFTERDSAGTRVRAGIRSQYFPVYYLYPLATNEIAFGFDLNSSSQHQRFIQMAISRKTPVISDPVSLVQFSPDERDLLLFDPVMGPTETAGNNGSEHLQGFVLLAFSPRHLVNTATASLSRNGLFLTIDDVTDKGQRATLLHSEGGLEAYEAYRSLNFLNRHWELRLRPSIPFLDQIPTWQSYAVLFAGWPFVMVLSVLLIMLTGKQVAIEQQVMEKTAELAAACELAQQASRAKSDFLASMSHELRTPLNSIIGFTRQVLTKKTAQLDDRSLDSLQTVARNAEHLLKLINDLLDIAKIEAGKMELHMTTFDVASLCQEVLEPFRQAARDKNIQLQTHIMVNLMLTADRTRLFQILLNLVANAMKFTHGGFVKIEARPEVRQNISGIRFDVCDSGIGIAPSDQHLLFNKFVQLQPGRKSLGGTGLGLALVKEIATLHNGSVSVHSALGEGSVFSVWIPEGKAG